ncbi:Brachyurin [Eumeta japonica]|uniref:Brachyurin n=1 Tax=Eumeta variegata TaxID=151549 RepID=A0A4C1VSV5_EUMVA|nr:Brachyurin [Eumeta japonica]
MVIGYILLSSVVIVEISPQGHSIQNGLTAFDYHSRIGIPEAARIKEYEEREKALRIVGGWAAKPITYPYQAGLLITFSKTDSYSVCGACLLSETRLVTAGHCWYDGSIQAKRFEVVLGTDTLFKGGVRVETEDVIVHENYNPIANVNDIAIIKVPQITYTPLISNITLPDRADIYESFVDHWAWASGFGKASDSQHIFFLRESFTKFDASLRQVKLRIIPNSDCRKVYRSITDSHICTSGVGGVGTCGGDSGGPLALEKNGEKILVEEYSVVTFREARNLLIDWSGACLLRLDVYHLTYSMESFSRLESTGTHPNAIDSTMSLRSEGVSSSLNLAA